MAWVWIIIAILYILSPYDLLPDFIPVRGWIDDAVVMVLLYRYVSKYLARRRSRAKPADTGQAEQPRSSDRGNSPKTPYEVLGVSPSATEEQIRSAYRKLASQYHPDKVAHLGSELQELAEKRFKEIQTAYQHLNR
jgi:DnaJ like chaperone protein